ncbi:alpha-L-rhamnosidase-related protein [Rhodococcus sp. NPDC003382]
MTLTPVRRSPGAAFWIPDEAEAYRWAAEWIWSAEPALVPRSVVPFGAHDPKRFDRWVLFRGMVDLPRVPESADLRITADSRYRLWINGVEIGTGPSRHGPRSLTADRYPVATTLRPGRNVVAVLGRFYGHAVPWWEPAAPSFTTGGGGLLAELDCDGEVVLATGDGWRAYPADAWTPSRPLSMLTSQIPEVFDARLLDPAWTSVDFDDTAWPTATVLYEHAVVGPVGRARPPIGPYGQIGKRPIPLLTGHIRTPASREQFALPDDDPSDVYTRLGTDVAAAVPGTAGAASAPRGSGQRRLVVYDFAAIVAGTVYLELSGKEGDTVTGALVEAVSPVAFRSAAAFEVTMRNGDLSFEPDNPVGGRYLVLSVNSPTLEIHRVEVRERRRPRVPTGGFRCSDTLLNRIFDVSVRTVDLTSRDAYLDCPTREQRAWTGDAVVHQSVDLVVNGDWSLARWNPRLLAQPRQDGMLPIVAVGDFANPVVPPIPDWALHWIRSVHNLYRYIGDRALVAELLPVAERVLRWFLPYRRADGLLHEVPGWVLIDWSPVQVTGCSAALNALWARALRDFGEMSEWLGDAGKGTWAQSLHGDVRVGFEAFWDPVRRAYRDTLPDGDRPRAVSEHTAAAAVTAGLVPAERNDAVLALLLDRDAMFTRTPLSDHGVDKAGPENGAPISVRPEPDWDTETLVVGAQPFFRYVVHEAIVQLGAAHRLPVLCRDWRELLATGPTALRECWEGGSFAHGWSATPARDLVTFTLGISPAAPGYGRVQIAPRLGDLDWAEGSAPTPAGVVTVRATSELVELTSPVPVDYIGEDGRVLSLDPGNHEIEVRL